MKRIGKVINNKDDKKLGRVKAQILPEFIEISDENNLPWVYPVQKYGHGTFNIPEKDSYIVVEVDDTWTSFYYDGSNPFSESEGTSSNALDALSNVNSLKSKKDGAQPLFLSYTKDGMTFFHDTDTGEAGLVTKDGLYVLICEKKFTVGQGSDLTLEIEAGNKIKLENSKDVEVSAGQSTLKIKSNGQLNFEGVINSGLLAMATPVKDILQSLMTHMHNCSGAGAPSGPAMTSSMIPLAVDQLANLQKIGSK